MAITPLSRVPSRGDVFLVELEPTRGSEIRKTRPAMVVSPDELNHQLHTVIIAPMTTAGRESPFRVACRFGGKRGRIILDQLRTVDRERLRKRLGTITPGTLQDALRILGEMFEP